MKRSAESNANNIRRSSRRTTRSATRQEKEAEQHHARASALMSTPLLRAMPAVLSSGYLFQYDCMTAAATCQDWYHVWKEVEPDLPDVAKLQVYSTIENHCSWVRDRGLRETLQSPEFVRQIFDKVNALKVAAKTTPGARVKAQDALPVYGVDIQVAAVYVWGPNRHNRGGVCIRYGTKRNFNITQQGYPYWYGRTKMMVRLDIDLVLWTGIRKRDVYDEQPLWP